MTDTGTGEVEATDIGTSEAGATDPDTGTPTTGDDPGSTNGGNMGSATDTDGVQSRARSSSRTSVVDS
jgi:hypothetical protein